MKTVLLLFVCFLLCSSIRAQGIGSKVSFIAVDGKKYTGTITELQGAQSKVKYDNYNFEAWLANATLTYENAPAEEFRQATRPTGDWKIGDKVDVQDMYQNNEWEPATITIIHDDWNPKRYKASLDNPAGHSITDLLLTSNQIRTRGLKAAKFAVGTHVNAYYADADMSPKGKARVIEDKGNGRYKIHYDGCGNHFDEVVDWSQLKLASVVAANNADITVLMGKWAMFVYSYPNTVIHNNTIYREYGSGAKAPPLQINSNGTYVWYDEYNKPPVKGTWQTDAKVDGVKTSTDAYNGIILKDSYGTTWKIHLDRQDHIEARKQCSGETEGGTRIK